MSIWDDPDLAVNDDYIKLENVGDTAAGTIRSIRAHRFDDGKVVPQILLACDDGEERTLTAGQVRLKALLSEQRPDAGDHITVKLTEIEKRSGGKTLKHFSLDVKRGGATQAAPEPAAATPAVDQAAVAAALAALTPEQKEQLGIPA